MEILKNNYIDDDIIWGKLQNGLQYYIIKRKKYVSKLGLLSVNFGSIDNKFSLNGKVNYVKEGSAHLLEHLTFFHKHFNVMDRFSRLEANVNAYTNFTTTAYHFNTINNYYSCLNSLNDFVFSSHITNDNLKLEKDIVYNEIKMFNDNPQYKAFFNMLKSLVKKTSLSDSIVGTHESLLSTSLEELEYIYDTFYVPSNMAFVGVGDIDEFKILESLNSIVKKNTPVVKRYYANDDSCISNVFIKEFMNVSKNFFCFGLKINFNEIVNLKTSIIFSTILEMVFGESSNIYELLSLKGLIDNDFFYDFITFYETGIIILQGSTNNAEQVLEEITYAISKIIGYIDFENFEIIKRKKIGKILQNFNSIDFVSTFQVELIKENLTFHDYFNFLNELKFTDIELNLDKIKIDNNYVFSVVSNKPS